jgi:hypothetical protein
MIDQMEAPVAEMNERSAAGEVVIHINKQQYKVPPQITGAQLRALGQIAAENTLFLERHGQQPDEPIDPSRTYELKNGDSFYDLPRGTVGDEPPPQVAYARDHLEAGRAEPAPGGVWVLRWQAELPSPWMPSRVEFLVEVPPQFPAQAPAGFDVMPAVNRNGSPPGGAGQRELLGGTTTHLCWNPNGTIPYAAPDGLWRFAKFTETRFREAQ